MKNKKQITDAQLLNSYRDGDHQAFAVLLKRYKSKVFTSIYLIVKDKYLAEDLTQECFIKVIERIRKGNYFEEGKFGQWIGCIAHNLAIDNYRKQKRYPTILTEDGRDVFVGVEFTEESIENTFLINDTKERIRSLINQLPEDQKQVLIMRHYNDLSFKEIAEETGVSINTALGRMRYALMNLRKLMQQTEIAYDKNYYPT